MPSFCLRVDPRCGWDRWRFNCPNFAEKDLVAGILEETALD
jgi:hypothetical protein